MRVLVCGGRCYPHEDRVSAALDGLLAGSPPLRCVIQGEAGGGADLAARRWAGSRGVACIGMPAAWPYYGRAAGPFRNGWMIEFGQPDLVLAFPGGKGTENMVRQAETAGIEVRRIDDGEDD